MNEKEDFLVDCMITAGELDESGYHFFDNGLKVVEVAKSNVPYSEFLRWQYSDECWNRLKELEDIGREHFGKDYWMKYRVCHFCTLSHNG